METKTIFEIAVVVLLLALVIGIAQIDIYSWDKFFKNTQLSPEDTNLDRTGKIGIRFIGSIFIFLFNLIALIILGFLVTRIFSSRGRKKQVKLTKI